MQTCSTSEKLSLKHGVSLMAQYSQRGLTGLEALMVVEEEEEEGDS